MIIISRSEDLKAVWHRRTRRVIVLCVGDKLGLWFCLFSEDALSPGDAAAGLMDDDRCQGSAGKGAAAGGGGEINKPGPGLTCWSREMGPQKVILSFCLVLCMFEIFRNKQLFEKHSNKSSLLRN